MTSLWVSGLNTERVIAQVPLVCNRQNKVNRGVKGSMADFTKGNHGMEHSIADFTKNDRGMECSMADFTMYDHGVEDSMADFAKVYPYFGRFNG